MGPLEWETCRDYVVPALHDAGWQPEQVVEQYRITDGRIIPRPHRRGSGRRDHTRARELRADYLLEYRPGFPIAVVEAKREYAKPADGFGQAKRYAQLLKLPLAYATNGLGIIEHDYSTGLERELTAFPSPEEMLHRFRVWKGLEEDEVVENLLLPLNRDLRNPDGTVKEPRYYQRIAVEEALEAILGRNQRRVLLTLATGTGKTFTALQILWKLRNSSWRTDRPPRFLYLADRNVLIEQPIAREFRPVFGEALWRLRGTPQYGRELYFALYQSLADTKDSLGLFRDYPPDFFDLIVVDECHRGSASDESNWRSILNHFSSAVQLGMTATPRRADNADTYQYFGNPVFEYSLAQGIEDGFLAPYRVRRVILSPDAFGWSPDPGELDRFGREIPAGLYETKHFERVVSLLGRTEIAARHLTEYMQRTDPMAKTIVFCVDSEHAEQMRMALNNANRELSRQHPDYVVRIVSAEGDVGVEHLGVFADPEQATPVIATTSKLLSTGVDIPTIKNIVLFKPIGSMVEFKQTIGRGTRLYPDDDKLTFDIIDYTGATRLFADPEFDGPPERVVEEHITVDDDGEIVTTETDGEEDPVDDDEPQGGGADPEDVESRSQGKFYVDGATAWITAEGFYVPDPDSGALRLVEYEDHVANEVRKICTTPSDLRERWRNRIGRQEVIDVLERRGVSFEEITERTGLDEVDPFDLLVHLAWNTPTVTRRDRVRQLNSDHAAWLQTFVPEARAILGDLLEKYAEHGIDQLEDLRVLEIPPIPVHGSPVQIASRFGGVAGLRAALADLEDRLYAA